MCSFKFRVVHVRNERKFLFFFFFYQDFVPVTEQPVVKNFSINNMVMEERMRQAGQQPPPWHEHDEVDSTRVSKHLFVLLGKMTSTSLQLLESYRNLQSSFGC